jgi:hypothetical protein
LTSAGQHVERFIRAVVSRDVDFLADLDDTDARPLGVAITASFIALVRSRLELSDETAISSAASADELFDGDEQRIPPWVVEGAMRMALGEVHMGEGIPPKLLVDTHLAYVQHASGGMTDARREELVAAGVGVALEVS